jgi:multiple sugar transport system ATP-binding protein
MFVGGFVGSPPMNFIPVEAKSGSVALGAQSLIAPRASGPLTLGFRGEDVTLAPPGEAMPFTVRVAEPMGSHVLLTGRIGDAVVRVVAPPASPVKAGDVVGLRLDPDRVVFMDTTTGVATDLAA